jgi:heme/copper-type cytochrome/quinol oxidase subunit 2
VFVLSSHLLLAAFRGRAVQTYASDIPDEDSGVRDFLFSTQMILVLILVGVVAVLLAYDLWASRRGRDSDGFQPPRPPDRARPE